MESSVTNSTGPSPTSTDATVMIDARYLYGQIKGIGRYTEHLVRHLLEVDDTIHLRLVTHPDRPEPVEHDRVTCQTFSALPTSLSTRFLLSKHVDFTGVDLFHSPFSILPADLPVPAVATLHDLMWVIDPSFFTSQMLRRIVTGTFYRTFIPRSVREAAAILTISEFSRQEIAEEYPDTEKRIDVTYNGVDPFFHPVRPERGWPTISDLVAPKSQFVFLIGQGSPYKNHARAVRGFLDAFANDPQVYLVLVRRPKGQPDDELEALLADPRLNSRVIRRDYVSGDQLRALYSLATAFVFPSLYEGFGLPALEAMACGTAVVTSDRGATKEICADGAVLVDPTEPEAIGAALRRLFDDDDHLADMERRAGARARDFRWQVCARRTIDVYNRLLDRME